MFAFVCFSCIYAQTQSRLDTPPTSPSVGSCQRVADLLSQSSSGSSVHFRFHQNDRKLVVITGSSINRARIGGIPSLFLLPVPFFPSSHVPLSSLSPPLPPFPLPHSLDPTLITLPEVVITGAELAVLCSGWNSVAVDVDCRLACWVGQQ